MLFSDKKKFSSSAASPDTVKVEVSFEPKSMSKFTTYKTNPETFETSFHINPQSRNRLGEYLIKINLFDEADQ